MQSYLSNIFVSFFLLQAVICEDFKLNPAQLISEELEVIGDDIDSLNSNIGEAKNLKVFTIFITDITSLPEALAKCISLEKLTINSNDKLMDPFPDFLKDLKNLKKLTIIDQPLMKRVPTAIYSLEKLEVLDISRNKLEELPYRILDLDNFKNLIIDKLQLASLGPEEEAEAREKFDEKLTIIFSFDDTKRLFNEAVNGYHQNVADEVPTKDLGKCCIS